MADSLDLRRALTPTVGKNDCLLTDNEKADMEKVVEKKLEEMRARVLAWEPDELDLKILS